MVADAFHHSDRTRVSHRESFPDTPPGIERTARSAVQQRIAGNHLLLGHEGCVLTRPKRDSSTREPLSHVIVCIADNDQRDARWQERTE